MADRGPPGDEERLPWLEPYRDVMASKQRIARRSHGGLIAVASAMALLFAAAGGFWFGQRDTPSKPATQVALAPVKPAAIVPPPVVEVAPPVTSEPTTAATTKVAPATRVASKPKKVAKRPVRERKIRSAGIESARIEEVREAQERVPAPRPVARAWPRMPSPGPGGQVIQLGAFRHPDGAYRAYRSRLARYPMLGSMPRVIVPVATKPRGRILYVLRLGTTSRQQSAIVCRNLRASGDHCLVIG